MPLVTWLARQTALTSNVPVGTQHWWVMVGRGKGLISDSMELQSGVWGRQHGWSKRCEWHAQQCAQSQTAASKQVFISHKCTAVCMQELLWCLKSSLLTIVYMCTNVHTTMNVWMPLGHTYFVNPNSACRFHTWHFMYATFSTWRTQASVHNIQTNTNYDSTEEARGVSIMAVPFIYVPAFKDIMFYLSQELRMHS